MSGLQIDPPFSQGVGYALILGIGSLFTIGMSIVSWGLSRFFAERQTSEMFMTGKRSVKTGLTASAVVSSWTIAATLLTSSTVGYTQGISGPFWYGAGATVQILLYSVGAIEIKRKAPNCHTLLEFTRKRYGPVGHLTLAFYSLFFLDAACFLFPIGVVIYSLAGGIKATFLTDWVHTVVIYIIMIMSLFVVFATSNVVGSSDAMFDLLQNAQKLHPVAGNAEGSYLTMKSVEGGFFGLIILGAGFAGSVDPQLSQKAIAANPGSTLMGYLLGGSAWFTIPFCLATTYGLLAAAVEQLPVFPTYPHPMNAFEVASGMAMPYAALAVMGKGGAMAILLMVFMAVTSALSSETMAVTALMTYDVYQAYINPKATGKQLVRFGHCIVPVFGLFVASVAVGLNHAGFNVSFIITAVGVFVASAFIPQACTIFWGKQGLLAAVGAPLISSAAAIIAWFMVAKHESGYISITTLSGNLALVAGNMTSFAGPIVLTPLLSYIKPQNYDWNLLKEIKQADDADEGTSGIMESSTHTNLEAEETMTTNSDAQMKAENAMLLRARTKAIWASVSLTLVYLLLWPIPMYGTGYVFSKGFFKGWVVVLFLWAFYAASTITLLPLWEGRHSIIAFFRFLFKSKGKTAAETRVILEGLPENQGRPDDGVSHNVTRSEKCVTADVSQ
ncbi:Na+ solute symporter [Fusarium tjaetaba]|uniref:Na+ solute symporter n=1 Tax=Fusarium tjaetaba TaxID=1567544 RepID=A0A8H5QIZ4_9HYPO|nr:Na+ solute symporter [Fusarium tjaetaba]KAF5615599.1 Na+ solute symporter [Fusarium tjaetaba]